MGLIGCPETSVRKYHSLLRNNPEERFYHYVVVEAQVTQNTRNVS